MQHSGSSLYGYASLIVNRVLTFAYLQGGLEAHWASSCLVITRYVFVPSLTAERADSGSPAFRRAFLDVSIGVTSNTVLMTDNIPALG